MFQPYRDVFARPGAVAFSAAGAVARMPMAMVGIAIVLVVSSLYGSYGLAGRVSAACLVAAAATGPLIARLVDRHGQSRVMRPVVTVGCAGLVVLAVAAATHAHPAWLYAGAVLAGSGGNFGSLVRARWTYALAGEPRLLHTAYSLESAVDELIFVVGPVVATFLATSAAPVTGLLAPLLAVAVGAVWFLSLRRTEPPAAPRAAGHPGGNVLRIPGMVLLVVVFVGMGAIFGATDVATVAFAEEQGNKGAAGVVLAMFALGSMLSGLLYGARHWHRPLPQRFAVAMVLLALGESLFLIVGNLVALAATMFVVGFTISPSIIAGNGLVQALVPARRLTEGLTWVVTALTVGVSVGSSVGGARVDAAGSRGGFLVVFGVGVAVAAATLLAYPGLRRAGRGAQAADEPAPVEAAA